MSRPVLRAARLGGTDLPDPRAAWSAATRRVRQFIVWDGLAAVCGIALSLGLYAGVRPNGWLLVLAGIVAGDCLVLAAAWRLGFRGDHRGAVTLICGGTWVTAVGVTLVAPVTLPMMALAAQLPVVFAVPYVSRARLAWFTAVTVGCALALGLVARLQQVSGLSGQLPAALDDIVVIAILPPITGLVLLLVWQASTTLRDAVDQATSTAGQLHDANQELARRADELAASRHRLATAADAERRRIERDLHDGAQQHLVAAAVTLRLARRTAQTDPSGSAVLLGDLAGQLHDAIGEIRRLARGIYPPVLAANGLPAALPAAAAKAGLPTTVHLDGIGRYPPQIEAAVYFCCLEALNNAAKHAGAHARATITARQDAATLTVTITDTGHGYNPAATSHGTGLTNIADRLAVHAGTLHIRTQPNHGTTLTLQIPATKPATPQ